MKFALLLFVPAVFAWSCQPGDDGGYCNPNAEEQGHYLSSQLCDSEHKCTKAGGTCTPDYALVWVKSKSRHESRASCK
ncbi:hypothetical protein EJ03DRAFT_331725 [Teratosphaeria nubilosa]|uniref:CBM1 domain-containing protein n=1 Tax=Teratosphaeria nubilosa TaxID=161662 RepID=A0A6G1KVW8_9PEZI|nr:hypothetical protein EJ03DRAFT_331725 [Teratosphaeria nubilosa]